MADEKTLLTLEELSAWMTQQVQQFEDCEDTTIIVRYKLQEPDAEGVNWSEDLGYRLGPNATAELITAHIKSILQDARMRFNVKE